ncbi:filamentous hemagglutinin N-terminal domain-containing protein [Variovorax sp. J22R133]|uniref:two-partner secretion domain-containing protein n=1 Tax=Variovorax brevis TaxID=3053503 RepID=UPI002574F39B|nr:filamentous hemagglutinin N-terminal domain-containing protein [Variovorax sp. J22R133]MDM0117009.1 filamentous hemagglutinin N-terminal domain-containing protein [Variovorax sp. J22R133]
MTSHHAHLVAPRHLRLRPLALSLLCMGLAPALAQVLPVPMPIAPAPGGQPFVAGGAVSIVPGAPAGTMNILQTTPRAIAQWQSFSIGADNTVNIAQPANTSVLLNRVLGNDMSTIAGKLIANGHVYLVNPSGVTFSKGSSVSVGGLVASTLNVSNENFMAGGKLLFERDNTVTAKVVNQGAITSTGGPVVLMGAGVENGADGTINVAGGGSIGLVSARTVTVDFNGDGLTTFTIPADSKATTALVQNAGVLTADGGQVSLLAASTAQAQVVNQTGVIQAKSLATRGGQIVLGASGDSNGMAVGGTLDVSSAESGVNGGTISATATGKLAVTGKLSAQGNGEASGGQVLTQGDHVEVGPAAVINAAGGLPSANGTWTVQSGQDITVANTVPTAVGSVVNASALGVALSSSTNVVLNSDASTVAGQSPGTGVTFAEGAKVVKAVGSGAASLTVNSVRNIHMKAGSAIQSGTGPLNVDFNADSKGTFVDEVVPVLDGVTDAQKRGNIAMDSASIETNGGNILFHGQTDPSGRRGWATGSYSADQSQLNGITLRNSLLSTCPPGAESCTNLGSIALFGQGISQVTSATERVSGIGVGIFGSKLLAGADTIGIDAWGALGSSALQMSPLAGVASSIRTFTGGIDITGRANARGLTDPGATYTAAAQPAGPAIIVGDTALADADPSGTNGDRIRMLRGGALVTSAPEVAGDGGHVGLTANTDLFVDATLLARGTGGGAGGTVETSGSYVLVGGGTRIDAAGGPGVPGTPGVPGIPGGANGKWTLTSTQDLTINNNTLTAESRDTLDRLVINDPQMGSVVNAGALGRALGRSTDVELTSQAVETLPNSPGYGVRIAGDTRVVKTEGGASTLTVNSSRNITMNANSAIQSSAGALNVAFNADAQGEALPDNLPINTGTSEVSSGGAISLTTARIETSGGNIRFYGQSDPDNGRAVGSYFNGGEIQNGISLTGGSVLSACAMDQTSCTVAGDISLRGQGNTGAETSLVFGGVGVGIDNSTVRTGSGAITMDGRGGLGASGVRVARGSTIASGSGDITATGTTRSWDGELDPVVTFRSDDTADLAGVQMGGGGGVSVRNSSLSTGGNITLDGTGADLQALAFDRSFQFATLPLMVNNSAIVGGSNGVTLNESTLKAGVGRNISISGTAGSDTYEVSTFQSSLTTFLDATSEGVAINATTAGVLTPLPTRFIEAEGGTITVDGRGTGVRLTLGLASLSTSTSTSTFTNDSLLSVASLNGPGGAIEITGKDIYANSTLPAQHLLDASGTSGGKIHLVGDGTLELYQGLSADASGSGQGGDILTQGRAVFIAESTQVSAAGGPTGANGKWTVNSNLDLTIDITESGGSQVDSGVLGRALSRSTDVVINSDAVADGDSTFGLGVRFGNGEQVVKDGGHDTTFTVNSGRNIVMGPNSAIVASSGALNVNFNADANGAALPATLPISNSAITTPSGGAITINSASIQTNGGSIRFYGQGDPDNGRAVGSTGTFGDRTYNGVTIDNSLLSACAPGATACTSPGDISLRGQGQSTFNGNSFVASGAGVDIANSGLLTGLGSIAVDGRGGAASAGVQIAGGYTLLNDAGQVVASAKAVESTSGEVSLTGTTRGWATGDRVVVGSNGCNDCEHLDGVSIQDAAISTGGNVAINGTGADLTTLFNDPAYRAAITANVATVRPSLGVNIGNTSIIAGSGKNLAITGKGGSGEMTLTFDANRVPTATIDPQRLGVSVFGFDYTPLQAAGGKISIDGVGTDVRLQYIQDSAAAPVPMVDVASSSAAGGSIDVRGRNITVLNDGMSPDALFDARGVGGGGSISLRGNADPGLADSGMIAVSNDVVMRADAVGSGNGGTIRLVADGSLRGFGTYTARGGAAGGDGGLVETSGRFFDIAGINVDASAVAGKAGTWLVDPYDVTIVGGAANGSLPTEPFVPLSKATIQDGDINRALNSGTNVSITTGNSGDDFGNITMGANGVNIALTNPQVPAVTFRLDAAGNITTFGGPTSILSSAAPLSVSFNAGLGGKGGAIYYSGNMLTNGGTVDMTAPGGTMGCAICLVGANVDTRIGQSDTSAGANVNLTVPAGGPQYFGFKTAAVDLDFAQISTSTGNVTVTGNAPAGGGVRVRGQQGANASGGISTTTGNIALSGIGAFASNSSDAPGHGVLIDGATLRTSGGNIAVRGLQQAGAGGAPGNGVSMLRGATVVTTGAGDIDISGESQGNGAGLLMAAEVPPNPAQEQEGAPATSISGGRNVVLRASNDGTTDAIVLDGSVTAANVLNLRPGGVDAATGAAVDRTGNPIVLGSGTGFALSADELTRLSAKAVVVGSNAHAGNIDVTTPVTSAAALTLQDGGGGNITLNGSINAPTLGLVSAGNITQAANAGITAGSLLATSSKGNVTLNSASNNVGTNTLAGGAQGSFQFTNSGAIRIGPVPVAGYDAETNAPNTISVNSMAADTVMVRALSGNLTLDSNVSAATSTDLVAAGTFQNPEGHTITGGPFRIWANTWVGETRGGIVGSGDFPNFYHCTFLGECAVVVTEGNHFIYTQQPTATITLDSFQRQFGQENPRFTYRLDGLILDDRGLGISGTPGTEANANSPAGQYRIAGTFTSREGYAIDVLPGLLTIADVIRENFNEQFFNLPRVDYYRDEPTTWVYDRNIGFAPICVATGPLDTSRGAQKGDVLAREWSRVRTRPNLTSCVDTERHNGCADF